ncbi:uncharacterized protein C20orf144 homolog [Oryctolagus cuniculus]|uniref:uncharacterized protein C20orf144 homolog n=1 Tax=Oryctolagus cuniculus TaxID=9986 RepID=UPI0022320231|nr:uncharacterized protein C20orf144 homolog [Oryctolagus cuniculus]
MGNSSSQKRAKAPTQACEEIPPDADEAGRKQFFSHLKGKKPGAKILLLLHLDKRQQRAEAAAAGPGAQPGEDVPRGSVGFPAAAPMLRGAGDGTERREGTREREMKKILVVLLLLDARLREDGRRAAGGPKAPGSGPRPDASPPASSAAPGEERPRKRRRCPRPRP